MHQTKATYFNAFGSPMPTRVWSDPNVRYKYGFNSKELDKADEGMGGGGSTYDYGFRIYNPNLGRFLSVDPLSKSYPWYTPYQFAGNNSIVAIDIDGLEQYFVTKTFTADNSGFSVSAEIKFRTPNQYRLKWNNRFK